MAHSEPVPAAVTRLLSARYPTLEVNPTWLQACVRDVRQRGSALTASPDQLARAVRQELLDTDLAQVVPSSYRRITPEALHSPTGKLGDVGRGAVLVQIESMIDIGYSASLQLEIAEARREARRANVDPNDGLAEIKAAAATAVADHMADFQAQEDDKVQATTVYPRRMPKLELSDGSKEANVFAIELQRIAGLDMNTTKIGAKLLLKGALIKDGYLLLTPQTVTVEGGGVKAKDDVAEDEFINKLRAQLGKGPSSGNAAETPNGSTTRNLAPPDPDMTAVRPERDFSPDEDESELLAALEAEEDMMMASAVPVRSAASTTVKLNAGDLRKNGMADKADSQQAPPKRKRAELIVPEGMSQSSSSKSRSQQSNATPTTRVNATQYDPISLIDSDDDEFFNSLDDNALSAVDVERKFGPVQRSRGEPKATLSNSRYEPIVIESSPEP